MRQVKIKEYQDKFSNPYIAARDGHVDAVIQPEETREFLTHAIRVSASKSETRPERKHGIPPF
jgi:acetyl-CoA carboxylase carboxyltransferase component